MITTENILNAEDHIRALTVEHEARNGPAQLDAVGIQSDESMLNAIVDITNRLLEERPDIASMPAGVGAFGVTLGIAIGVQAAREETRGGGS